jgi:capsular polysaccharide biosynthesis protein
VDLWDLTKLLFRRWYIAVPLLVVSLAAVALTSRSLQPDYSASGHLQLIPPRAAAQQANGTTNRTPNPWMDLGYQALGQALIIKITDKNVLESLTKGGYSENFAITMDTRSPLLTIEVVAHNPTQATGTVRQVMQQLEDMVKSEQTQYGVAQQDSITTLRLDDGSAVTTVTSKVKRVLIVAGGVALLFTTAFTIGIDAYLRRRKRRAEALTVDEAADQAVLAETAPLRSSVGAPKLNGSHKPAEVGARAGQSSAGADGTRSGQAGPINTAGPAKAPAAAGNVFRSASAHGEEPGRGEAADNGAENGRDAEIDLSAVPPDATIILPLSHIQWPARDDESRWR